MKLNEPGYEHARRLVQEGRVALDERDAWAEHQPSGGQESEYIEQHGLDDYRHWFLGMAEDLDEESKTRYTFPYGDFEQVHRCGVLSAEVRAGEYKYEDIEVAAAHLHGMLDELRRKAPETEEPTRSTRR
jgi:hypothetical protein